MVAERFPRDVAGHQMIPSRDDGLYRHLRFRRVAPWVKDGVTQPPSRSSSYWFDLVTWPGHLTITGDCGTYTFARTDDMFEFFRGQQINPGYWAEKVKAGGCVSEYSPEQFRAQVMDSLRECEEDYPGLTAAAEEEIFGDLSQWATDYEDGAREALRDFSFGDTYKATCTCGAAGGGGFTFVQAEAWRREHRLEKGLGHITDSDKVEGFTFSDPWEWDLSDFSFHFLWCLHAIVWGIARHDASKAVSA
jgi:hypothetical protein